MVGQQHLYDELKELRKENKRLKEERGAGYLKKSRRVLCERKPVKYAFIKSHQSDFSVSRMCEVLEVSGSAYYDWLHRPVSQHEQEDQRLSEKIKEFYEASQGTYGARRLREDLLEAGESVSRARIDRLMKEQGLESKVKQRFKATTDSSHDLPVFPNHLNRQFEAAAPDQAYAGDITYSVPGVQGEHGQLK